MGNPADWSRWEEAQKKGRESADTLVKVVKSTKNPVLLGFYVGEIVRAGKYDRFEIAFFHRIAEELISGG